MTKTGLILLTSALLVTVLATLTWLRFEDGPARANPSPTVGLDMDPNGNFCSGPDTDCTLGFIDKCVSVPNQEGYEFQIDLWVNNLDNGFWNFNENLFFPTNSLLVQADDVTSAATVLQAQAVGSALSSESEFAPDPISPHASAVSENGPPELTPPFTRGVIDRITLRVTPGATSGIHDLSLSGPPLAAYLTSGGDAYAVDAIWDGGTGGVHDGSYGKVALGVPCPALPSPSPTPTFTPTFTPTATATPSTSATPTPTGTPAAGTVPLVAGWNDSCYQGDVQNVGDAFASVIADIQAVYRMKPDQGFDRWFPARPELNSITTLNPFDQLFILAGGSATWTVQSPAQLPSSMPLDAGWNSVCYLGGGNDTAAATAEIGDALSIIYSLSPNQAWQRYIPGQPEASTLARLETFTSVLILMAVPGTWTFSP